MTMIILMLDSLLIQVLLSGLGVALMTGPLGCFIAWQRLAYYGETVAHAALLGVVIALSASMPTLLGILLLSIAIALFVARALRQTSHAPDMMLGVAAHGAMAIALIWLAFDGSMQLNLEGFLFGDILAVTASDRALIWLCAACFWLIWIYFKRDIIRMVIHAELAQIEGVNVRFLRLLLMVMVAVTVALSIQMIGALLITSMLIIPPVAARYLAKTPVTMVLLSTLISACAIISGVFASWQFDSPTGPSIIVAALLLLLMSALTHLRRR